MTNKLFIAGLAFAATDEDLRAHFARVGDVVSARIARDRETQRSRGFGFVEMATPELAQKAIETLDGTLLSGRAITVKVSEPQERRPAGGPSRY
ncbi:RNA-binding protein [bacterium]|nr:RNA-binding protein [bacterium]